MEEDLFWMLDAKFEEGQIGRFCHPLDSPTISHLLYANDFLVFTNEECRFMMHLLKTIGLYEQWFDQKVNIAKSTLFFFLQESARFNKEAYSG